MGGKMISSAQVADIVQSIVSFVSLPAGCRMSLWEYNPATQTWQAWIEDTGSAEHFEELVELRRCDVLEKRSALDAFVLGKIRDALERLNRKRACP